MIETKRVADPRAEKLREWDEAAMAQIEANLDYVAMMADVDLPTWEEDETDE